MKFFMFFFIASTALAADATASATQTGAEMTWGDFNIPLILDGVSEVEVAVSYGNLFTGEWFTDLGSVVPISATTSSGATRTIVSVTRISGVIKVGLGAGSPGQYKLLIRAPAAPYLILWRVELPSSDIESAILLDTEIVQVGQGARFRSWIGFGNLGSQASSVEAKCLQNGSETLATPTSGEEDSLRGRTKEFQCLTTTLGGDITVIVTHRGVAFPAGEFLRTATGQVVVASRDGDVSELTKLTIQPYGLGHVRSTDTGLTRALGVQVSLQRNDRGVVTMGFVLQFGEDNTSTRTVGVVGQFSGAISSPVDLAVTPEDLRGNNGATPVYLTGISVQEDGTAARHWLPCRKISLGFLTPNDFGLAAPPSAVTIPPVPVYPAPPRRLSVPLPQQ